MPDQAKERSIFNLVPDDNFTRLIEDQWQREAELEQRFHQLQATPRIPQYLKDKAETQITAHFTSSLETGNAAPVQALRHQAFMNPQRVYFVLTVVVIAGVWWLLAHGLVFLGFVVAGLALGIAAYLSNPESPRGPLSKEEELAAWGVRWEVNDPISDGAKDTVQHEKSAMRKRKRKGTP